MQQIGAKRVQNKAWLGGKGDPLEIVQESKIWHCKQESDQENDAWNSRVFYDTNGLANLGQKTKRRANDHSSPPHKKRKWTCRLVDFAFPAEHWGKIKESEKIEK